MLCHAIHAGDRGIVDILPGLPQGCVEESSLNVAPLITIWWLRSLRPHKSSVVHNPSPTSHLTTVQRSVRIKCCLFISQGQKVNLTVTSSHFEESESASARSQLLKLDCFQLFFSCEATASIKYIFLPSFSSLSVKEQWLLIPVNVPCVCFLILQEMFFLKAIFIYISYVSFLRQLIVQ